MRAAHLQLVGSLTTREFLLTFRRFTTQRGLYKTTIWIMPLPSSMPQETWKRYGRLSVMKIIFASKHFQNCRIHWKLIVERAAWWSEFWEWLIHSIKNALKKTLKRSSLAYTGSYKLTQKAEPGGTYYLQGSAHKDQNERKSTRDTNKCYTRSYRQCLMQLRQPWTLSHWDHLLMTWTKHLTPANFMVRKGWPLSLQGV